MAMRKMISTVPRAMYVFARAGVRVPRVVFTYGRDVAKQHFCLMNDVAYLRKKRHKNGAKSIKSTRPFESNAWQHQKTVN